MPGSKRRDSGGRPRRVNQVLLDHMVELREQGFTSRGIAAEVGVSERTVKRYVSGVSPSLHRKPGLDSQEMLARLFNWVISLCRLMRLGFKDENKLALALREEVEGLDDLIVDQLREDERARRKFFIEFVLGSWLGKRAEFERECSPDLRHVLEMNGQRLLPDLKDALKRVLDKEIKSGGALTRSQKSA